MQRVNFVDRIALAAVFCDAEKEHVVGVARYRRLRSPVPDTLTVKAEVAFTVLEEEQGRGIGTLLLEHLAIIARAQGIAELEADLMIDNAKMMEVLQNSGFKLRESPDDGVHHVLFPAIATTRFLEVSHAHHPVEAKRW